MYRENGEKERSRERKGESDGAAGLGLSEEYLGSIGTNINISFDLYTHVKSLGKG